MKNKRQLLIGPLNQASQANIWAEALRSQLDLNAISVDKFGVLASILSSNRIDDSAERHLPHYRLSSSSKREKTFRKTLEETDYLLAESNQPFYNSPKEISFIDEINSSRLVYPSIALVFHGSEIRDPEIAIDLNPSSYFKELPKNYLQHLKSITSKNRLQAVESGFPLFVTTPDLLEHLPGSKLLPVSIDTSRWQMGSSRQLSKGRPVRVLHMPTNPLVKGTKYITPILQKLEEKGKIEVIKSISVPRDKMHSLYEKADIYIDQIQSNSFGVSALEAMSMGCAVISSTPNFGHDSIESVPIIDSNPSNFEEKLKDLIVNLPLLEDLQSTGASYVKKFHGPEQVAHSIWSGWLSNKEN